jgi:hypothetical protein
VCYEILGHGYWVPCSRSGGIARGSALRFEGLRCATTGKPGSNGELVTRRSSLPSTLLGTGLSRKKLYQNQAATAQAGIGYSMLDTRVLYSVKRKIIFLTFGWGKEQYGSASLPMA